MKPSAFQIDTSGYVGPYDVPQPRCNVTPMVFIAFANLDPFTQGAVEAALRELLPDPRAWAKAGAERMLAGRKGHGGGPCMKRNLTEAELIAVLETAFVAGQKSRVVGFSDLAPETLARIMKDCAGFQRIHGFRGLAPPVDLSGAFGLAKAFWEARQRGADADFPPLRFYLSDDGMVRIVERDQ